MFVRSPEQVVLSLLIKICLVANAEIEASVEKLVHHEERFVCVCGGCQTCNRRVAAFRTNFIDSAVSGFQRFVDCLRPTIDTSRNEARPALQRMKAEASFVAQPAFIDVNISPADGAVDLSVRRGVAGNSTAYRSG